MSGEWKSLSSRRGTWKQLNFWMKISSTIFLCRSRYTSAFLFLSISIAHPFYSQKYHLSRKQSPWQALQPFQFVHDVLFPTIIPTFQADSLFRVVAQHKNRSLFFWCKIFHGENISRTFILCLPVKNYIRINYIWRGRKKTRISRLSKTCFSTQVVFRILLQRYSDMVHVHWEKKEEAVWMVFHALCG